jgi:hypothetical protein
MCGCPCGLLLFCLAAHLTSAFFEALTSYHEPIPLKWILISTAIDWFMVGQVVMFLSRLTEETPVNKKLARDLVDKWVCL